MDRPAWHYRCPCDCAWVGTSEERACFGCGGTGERVAISLRRSGPDGPDDAGPDPVTGTARPPAPAA